MLLNPLLEVIKHVREQIYNHKDRLSKNEALTKSVLVQPILRVLGWDPEDPNKVEPEYRSEYRPNSGAADYALIKKNKVVVIVEVKRLGEDLSKHITQASKYALDLGVEYLLLTNGVKWQLYKTFEPGIPIEKRIIMDVDLERDSPGDAALKLLVLWQLADEMFGKQPLELISLETKKFSSLTQPYQFKSKPLRSLETREIPLSDIEPKEYRGRDKSRPKKLILPDGTYVEIKSWRDLLINIASWLYNRGFITREKCPIAMDGMRRYIIHIKPIHEKNDNKGFLDKREIAEGIYLELNWSAERILEIIRYLADKYGPGSEKFILQF